MGEDKLLLTHDVIRIEDAQKIVASDSAGAISIFIGSHKLSRSALSVSLGTLLQGVLINFIYEITLTGTTRDTFEDKTVVRLEYEAYEDMAYKELAKLCKEIRDKWNVIHICIMHRLGYHCLCLINRLPIVLT